VSDFTQDGELDWANHMGDHPFEGVTVDELFDRVLASMNKHRHRPIPESEHPQIREYCEKQLEVLRRG
jgi:hypothetical protein